MLEYRIAEDETFDNIEIKDFSIRISRNEAIFEVVLDDDVVIASSYFGIVNDSCIFSIVVSEDYRRKGIGKRLLDGVLKEFRMLALDGIVDKIRVKVVHPAMESMLLDAGATCEDRFSDERVFVLGR